MNISGPKKHLSSNPMPDYIKQALDKNKLMKKFHTRPLYQQTDYLDWIVGSELEDARIKRLEQMIRELKAGNIYMGMEYHEKK